MLHIMIMNIVFLNIQVVLFPWSIYLQKRTIIQEDGVYNKRGF